MIALSLRYLLSRPRQTLLMLLGIFFGTVAYVAISGFMLGFREFMVGQLVNNNAHVHITARQQFLEPHALDRDFYGTEYQHIFWDPPPSGSESNQLIENPQAWYARLHADPRVAAFSPQLTANALFTKGSSTATVSIIGCNPTEQVLVTSIGDYLTEGKFSDLERGGNRLLIGSELQKQLGVHVLQTVQVSLEGNPALPFEVIGVFKTGSRLANNSAYGAIADIQSGMKRFNQINEIAVKLHDYSQAAWIATSWSQQSVDRIQSWDQINANIFDVFRMQDAIRFLSVGAIMIVAGFGIYNVLNMTVTQKRKDIAILRSMGYTPWDILFLFLSQGLILGFVATTLGLVFGYYLCLYIQTLPFSGGPMGGLMGHIMVSLNPVIYFQAAGLSLLAASIASILPARAAGKLTPIEIIRAGTE